MKTASAYKQTDLSDNSNILSKSKLSIGHATDITVAEMKQRDIAMKSQIDTLKEECLLSLLATVRKLFDKTKLGSSIMHYANCLKPYLATPASSSESFKLLIKPVLWFYS